MKSLALTLLLVCAVSVSAGEPGVVATVNGEPVTAARFAELWDSLSPEMEERYVKAGGKPTLLRAYLRKRILLQDAAKNGFEGASSLSSMSLKEESALFNRYVAEHFGPQIITDEVVSRYYVQNPDRFRHMDQSLVRQIFVSKEDKSVEAAREKLGRIMSDLHQVRAATRDGKAFLQQFAKAAAAHSEDEASAADGGSLGWRERFRLDPAVATAAFTIEPGAMSGIIESDKGLHLVLVEDRRPAGMETLENAAPVIRMTLVQRAAVEVLKAADKRTDELMAAGDVKVYAENIR
jgi:peptidyl-prolyl cis-trans isomerase C